MHPTGSLKHRLARSLFLYALCNGWIRAGHDRRRGLLGLDRGLRGVLRADARAAVHRGDARLHQQGEVRADRVPGRRAATWSTIRPRWSSRPEARRSSAAATSWTSSPTPSGPPTGAATTTSPSRSFSRWPRSGTRFRRGSSSGAGTGGTSATIGRYVRYQRLLHQDLRGGPGELGLLPGLRRGRLVVRDRLGSRIEGIGRPKVEASFLPSIVDRMMRVPDAASLAAMRIASASARPPRGRLDRHQPVGRLRPDRRDASNRARPDRWSPCSATAASATSTRTTATPG